MKIEQFQVKTIVSMEKKLNDDKGPRARYSAFINEIPDLGHIEEKSMHGVNEPSKKTTDFNLKTYTEAWSPNRHIFPFEYADENPQSKQYNFPQRSILFNPLG